MRTRAVQATLQRYAAADIGRRSADTTRWNDLIDAIDPRLRADAYWPQLAAQLAQAARSTADLRQIITTAARQGPLPDELPLPRWVAHRRHPVSGTATLATTIRGYGRLDHRRRRRVRRLTETITSDPAWPGRAISAADLTTWTPCDLLHVAAEHPADAADEDHPIPPGDYARLITYTVDAFTHRLQARLGIDIDLPPRARPPHPPMRKHSFRPTRKDPFDDFGEAPPFDDYFDIARPTNHLNTGPKKSEICNLKTSQQTDLYRNWASLWNWSPPLQQEYREVCKAINTLDAEIRAGNGPAMRAAADELLRMRRQVDADRPYSHAVTAVMEQWADADAAYNDTLRLIEHARTQLDLLRSPDADRARHRLGAPRRRVRPRCCPISRPRLQFQQALADAQAARAATAGGRRSSPSTTSLPRAARRTRRPDRRAGLRERRQYCAPELEQTDRDGRRAFAAMNRHLRHPRTAARLGASGRPPPGRRPPRPHALPSHPYRGIVGTRAAHHQTTQIVGGSAVSAQRRQTDATDRNRRGAVPPCSTSTSRRKVLWLSTTDASQRAPRRRAGRHHHHHRSPPPPSRRSAVGLAPEPSSSSTTRDR